ncbi:MAG: translocation/assembly module TamB domain-containing protein [Verrucomicrobiota bacterium]
MLLLLVVAGLTYRYWMGAALRPVASRFGVHFEKYERLEDGRFALSGIVRSNALFDLRISRVEGFFPDVWYSKIKKPGTNSTTPFVLINGWKLVVHTNQLQGTGTPASATNRTAYDWFKLAEGYLNQVKQWLPSATLLNGSVDYGGKIFSFAQITWKENNLDASGIWPVTFVPFELKARLGNGKPYQIYYTMPPLDLGVKLQFWETNSLLALKLSGSYKQTTISGNAELPRDSNLPLRATLSAPEFHLPAKYLKLQGYNEFTGSLLAKWRTNQFTVDLKGHADPFGGTQLPPADIQLTAKGDTNRFTVEKALSTAPGIELSISEPFEADYKGELLSENCIVSLNVDLDKLPWLKLKGHVEGKITLQRGNKFPVAQFQVHGADLAGYKVEVQQANLSGTLDWPRLQSIQARFVFPTNAFLTLTGGVDLATRELSPSAVEWSGKFGAALLPAGIDYGSSSGRIRVSGPVTNLHHSAEIQLRNLQTSQTRPMNLLATWEGQQLDLDQFQFRAAAGPALLSARGGGNLRNGKTNFIFRELTLGKGDQTYLSLAQPFQLSVSGGQYSNQVLRLIELKPLIWRGEGKQLSIAGNFAWPKQGQIDFAATNINPELFQYFVQRSLRGLELPRFSGNFHWDESPLYGSLRGALSFDQQILNRVFAQATLELDQSGLSLSDFEVQNTNGVIARAHGFLPVSIRPADPANRVRLSGKDTIDFKAESAPGQVFWDRLTNYTNLQLTNAAIALELHGSITNPTGSLNFTAASLKPLNIERPVPPLGAVQVIVALNEQRLTLTRASVEVASQPINVSGQVQLGSNFWSLSRSEILPYFETNAAFNIRAPEIKVAPLAPYISRFLAPSGIVKIDAGYGPGRNLSGGLSIVDVETRPIPKIGVIQNIGAQIKLQGQMIHLADLQGLIGGEALRMAGDVNIASSNLNRGYPLVNLTIQGNNIPLARNPDIILRSDLDLTVRNGTNMIPVIAGAAHLRDSFLLRDIQTLAPGRVTKPSRRPPYFSIEQEPVDNWLLNVRVRGDNFLRVRSPFFQGQVSLAMNVSGTMREPLAVGEATISSGRIIFPFAPLEVKQAIVSLTSEDPYRPRIFAIATGRVFGYDIRMQAEGPADEPNIQFSSVPALTSEQIVLMLTTGQIPRSDFGFTNQEKASKLAFFLGKSLLSKLNPGKPAQERLVIRSGEDISEQGRQTYSVEYKLNDRWSLIGEYDRFGALNADVKWKLFSK